MTTARKAKAPSGHWPGGADTDNERAAQYLDELKDTNLEFSLQERRYRGTVPLGDIVADLLERWTQEARDD